jgi:hypothetical protein
MTQIAPRWSADETRVRLIVENSELVGNSTPRGGFTGPELRIGRKFEWAGLVAVTAAVRGTMQQPRQPWSESEPAVVSGAR